MFGQKFEFFKHFFKTKFGGQKKTFLKKDSRILVKKRIFGWSVKKSVLLKTNFSGFSAYLSGGRKREGVHGRPVWSSSPKPVA